MKKRKLIAGVSILLGLIIVLCVVLMLAKYKIHLGEQGEITSQNFYFSSNFLKSDEVPPVYEIYGNTVTFEVRNYIDSKRINPTDIEYTVLPDGGTVDISRGSLTGAASSSATITLSYDFAANELQKEIPVSVTGTGDFSQTLKATFILIKTDSLRYEIKDRSNRAYAELYIYTGNTESNVTIKWDNAMLVIDETNDYVFGKVQNQTSPGKSSVAINPIPAHTTVKIVFFKQDTAQAYTCGITNSNGTITIS